jgi:hypothetical protein
MNPLLSSSRSARNGLRLARAVIMWAVGWILWTQPHGVLSAARLIPLAPEQLERLSERIVLGGVEAIEVGRDSSGRVHTRLSLRVHEVWKGPAVAQCDVVLGGGTLGEVHLAASEFSWPVVGERAAWFLIRNASGEWVLAALDQGCFRVGQNPGGTWLAWNRFHGRSMDAPPHAGASLRTTLSLDELRRRVAESKGGR